MPCCIRVIDRTQDVMDFHFGLRGNWCKRPGSVTVTYLLIGQLDDEAYLADHRLGLDCHGTKRRADHAARIAKL
jgi:hypothetical protein